MLHFITDMYVCQQVYLLIIGIKYSLNVNCVIYINIINNGL